MKWFKCLLGYHNWMMSGFRMYVQNRPEELVGKYMTNCSRCGCYGAITYDASEEGIVKYSNPKRVKK